MRLKSFPLVTPAIFLLAILLGVVYLQHKRDAADSLGADTVASAAQAPTAGGQPLEIVSGRRPSPEAIKAWQARKFGMFIHFGLYSVLGGIWKGEQVKSIYSEQIMLRAPIPRNEYELIAKEFNPQRWDPRAVARLAREAGMKFIVITAKHHDGFSLFDTKLSRFNVVAASPYGRDIIRELADAARAEGLGFGVYYSSIDWHEDSVPDMRNDNPISTHLENFDLGQLVELASNYGPLSEIWFDMGKPTPAQSKRWTDAVHTLQPDTMVSGRVFNHQGDFTVMGDNAIPNHVIDEPWQTPASIYSETWGYRSWQERKDLPGKVREHLLNLAKVVSRGGNYLLNIGPRGDGSVVEFEADVLRSMGKWLSLNGEAIYGTNPQPFRELEFGYATQKDGALYLLVTKWPADGKLRLPRMRNRITKAYFLSDSSRTALDTLAEQDAQVVQVQIPKLPEAVTVIAAEYSGDLSVAPPLLEPGEDGAYRLSRKDADEFFHYNGYGYYERPKLYKQSWSFMLPRTGETEVYALAKPGSAGATVEVEVNGTSTRVEIAPTPDGSEPVLHKLGQFPITGWQDSRITITPPKPFAKGTGTGIVFEGLLLKPAAARR
ncbi:MAG: alpha-L-fucosidase [Bryobacterales bacterium]|nr:alpha-L-fucosidase [Bryobacterales bacterium]